MEDGKHMAALARYQECGHMLAVFHLFPVPELGASKKSVLNNHDRTTHTTSLTRTRHE